MNNFEISPHALVLDQNLSLGARALYPLIRYLAWQNGRRVEADAVELPTVDEIAETLGCASSTCRTYVSELRNSGWVETRRASRNRPSLWIVRDDSRAPKSGAQGDSRAPKSGGPERRNPALAPSITDVTDEGTTSPPAGTVQIDPDSPPPVRHVDGRNVPLDVLCEVCGIDQANRDRVKWAISALNGQGRKQGIAHLFWIEAHRYAVEHDLLDDLAAVAADPSRFSESLAKAIRRKGTLYAELMKGAMLTPTALRDWWLDLERRRESGTLTPDEIRRYARA